MDGMEFGFFHNAFHQKNCVPVSKLFGFVLYVQCDIVTNQSGQKIMDESVLEGIKDYIYKVMFSIIVWLYSCSIQFGESVNLLCSLSGLMLAFFLRGEPLESRLPLTTP